MVPAAARLSSIGPSPVGADRGRVHSVDVRRERLGHDPGRHRLLADFGWAGDRAQGCRRGLPPNGAQHDRLVWQCRRTKAAMDLSQQTESRRLAASANLDVHRRASLGQFFTPEPVARLMAEMLHDLPGESVRILDPGAGIGSLSAAAVAQICASESDQRPIDLVAYEIDEALHPRLAETLAECEQLVDSCGRRLSWKLRNGDYIEDVAGQLTHRFGAREAEIFDAVIMNPPYRKINGGSPERAALEAVGLRVSNLYTAFLALASAQLSQDGLLVAITPRSFANGLYFEPFRHFFFDRVGPERLHTFESRGSLFADADVLQENIIIAARRGKRPIDVELVLSRGVGDIPDRRIVPSTEVIRLDDRRRFLRIPSEIEDTRVARVVAAMPCELDNLGLAVSTGRVVDFRSREHLRDEPEADTAPLIYPGHLKGGVVRWPGGDGFRKPNALATNPETKKLLLPNETYVLVKRFAAKEERKRVSAAITSSAYLPGDLVAFENHLNVFHRANHGLEPDLAHGLAAYLNSSLVDRYVRHFNGHTQINATDLRHLRYPSLEELSQLGCLVLTHGPEGQDELDKLVNSFLPDAEVAAEAA